MKTVMKVIGKGVSNEDEDQAASRTQATGIGSLNKGVHNKGILPTLEVTRDVSNSGNSCNFGLDNTLLPKIELITWDGKDLRKCVKYFEDFRMPLDQRILVEKSDAGFHN